MNFFKRKETIVENITFMAIMAAINVVFVLLTNFIPFFLFVFVFILALSSALVSVLCHKKYFVLYAIPTILLCSLVNISDTLFYIIPSLVTGFIFGLFYNKRFPSILIIVSLTLIQCLFTYCSLPFIELLFERDIVFDIAKIFGLEEYKYLNYIKHMFIFIISFIQEVVAYLIICSQLDKFTKEKSSDNTHIFLCSLINVTSLLLMVLFGFIYPEISYIFLFISLILTVENVLKTILKKSKFINIQLGIATLVGLFIFAALYPHVATYASLLLIGVFLFLLVIIVFINNCLLKSKEIDTIKSGN